MANATVLTQEALSSGVIPSLATGSNRILEVTFECQNGAANPTAPTSCTGGSGGTINGAYVTGDVGAQLRVAQSTFLFFESDLAALVGYDITPAGHSNAAFITKTIALIQDAEQVVPVNTAKSRSGSGTLTLPLTRLSNSLTRMKVLSNNVNFTATTANPAATGKISLAGVMALTHGSMSDSAGTVNATSDTSSQTSAVAWNYKSAVSQSADLNGGNPVKVGQTGITATLTGFTSIPTSVTCTYDSGSKSLTCSNIAGNSSAITFDLEDRSEGVDYPAIGDGLTFTITNGAETTVPTTSLAEKTGETVVAPFVDAITYHDTYFGYWWADDGFTVDGGEYVFVPSGFTPANFVLRDDSGFSSTSGGVVSGWFRPASGTGAGNVYYYEFTISDGGAVLVSRGQMPVLGIGYGIGI